LFLVEKSVLTNAPFMITLVGYVYIIENKVKQIDPSWVGQFDKDSLCFHVGLF
jgi:hypothetical protein